MNSTEWEHIKHVFLTAFDMPEQQRDEYLAECDEHVRAKVEKLLRADKNAESFIVEPAVIDTGLIKETEHDPFIDGNIDGYKIIREIGHGGMGTVYLANRDGESFDKTVALKLVKRGMDTNAVLKRFVMERSILAQLEHPNIAGLIDGGTTPDGLPYFVMEYVDGQPVTKYCGANNLSIRERLELFQKVCAAVSYAHANLVVHRDVKPSNILVTQDGTPKLLDFGIAKLLHPDWSLDTAEATATMFRILTPEYASPEQIRGLAVTTASDVYSLGVVLYELLTGERPYNIESRLPEEVAQIVLTEEPLKPSDARTRGHDKATTDPKSKIQNVKSLKGDLDNIILKALRKEPERRYQSVQEFSEDIRRHLTGLPVTATADTTFYRIEKFVKRHRAGVFAGSLIFFTLLVATTVTAWQANRANIERAKAEQRFEDVRKLANSVVFELHDSIENLPGSTPSRELLVTRALEYLDKLASEPESPNQLKMELADAYDKIGDIQGGLNTSQLGQHEKAFESYRKSLAIRETLVASEPNNSEFRSKLATGYSKIADLLWLEIKVKESEEMYQKSFELFSKLAAESPTDKEIRYKLAVCQHYLARILVVNGKTQEGITNARQAVAHLEELSASNPNDEKFQQGLTVGYDRVAEIEQMALHNYSEALLFYRKSQVISQKLLTADPQNTKLRRGVAVSFYNIAEVLEKLNKYQEALENSQKSLAIFTELLAADPKNEEFRQIVAAFETQVSGLLTKNGKPADAIKKLEKSLEVLNKQLVESHQNEIINFRIGVIHANLGVAYLALGSSQKSLTNLQTAKSNLQKSLTIYQGFLANGSLVGEDAERIPMVEQALKKCEEEIKRLARK